MWLRSEKRESRLRRTTDTKQATTTTTTTTATTAAAVELKKSATVKSTKHLKNAGTTNNNRKSNSVERTTANAKAKKSVKRLANNAGGGVGGGAGTAVVIVTRQNKNAILKNQRNNDGKENCWQAEQNDGHHGGEEAELDGKEDGDELQNTNSESVSLDAEQNISSSSCSCERPLNFNENELNLSKCISECDSTTDYYQDIRNEPSTSSASPNFYFKNQNDLVIPEVDSTTDLLPETSAAAASFSDADNAKRHKDLPKLTLPTSTTYHCFSNADKNVANNRPLSMSNTSTPPISATVSSFPPTPDLISLFDEELNKTAPDMCPYTDFYPYNNILTQALLSCTEVNTMCESSDNAITDSSFLALNQTTIDNLKALTNLQNHTTNFLSGITLPKPSCSSGSGGSSNPESFIHSATEPIHNTDTLQQHCDNDSATGGGIQLETDECMEIEPIPEHNRTEDVVWDAFDPYVFIKHLPPLTAEMRAKCPALPLKTRSSPEFSLVLDLDETLVHCSLQELSDASFKFPVLFQVYFSITMHVVIIIIKICLFFNLL